MSTHRLTPLNLKASVLRGPSHRPLCKGCGKEVPPSLWLFCSSSCADLWKLKTDTAYIREQVFLRDHGICARCGCDTVEALRQINALPSPQRKRRKQELKITGRKTLWDVDHVLPVFCGGGECSLDNLRTLCLVCHKRETAALALWRSGVGHRWCAVPFSVGRYS
jgi:5-methylcytosine-specific restriction enzyme A